MKCLLCNEYIKELKRSNEIINKLSEEIIELKVLIKKLSMEKVDES